MTRLERALRDFRGRGQFHDQPKLDEIVAASREEALDTVRGLVSAARTVVELAETRLPSPPPGVAGDVVSPPRRELMGSPLEGLRLTRPQREELLRLRMGTQHTYGRARARVQNRLAAMGLARLSEDCDLCRASPLGLALLAKLEEKGRDRGPRSRS